MCVRTYEGHVPTDTDSTSDESDIGGMGRYSHGPIGLVHQHWIRQVISAGSFAVHCTEMAETYHKTCMHRGTHGTKNQTQDSMLRVTLLTCRPALPITTTHLLPSPQSCQTKDPVFLRHNTRCIPNMGPRHLFSHAGIPRNDATCQRKGDPRGSVGLGL